MTHRGPGDAGEWWSADGRIGLAHRRSIIARRLAEGGAFREMFRSVLFNSQSIFDQRIVRGLLQGQDCGRSNGERLFALVLFELWHREYAATL